MKICLLYKCKIYALLHIFKIRSVRQIGVIGGWFWPLGLVFDTKGLEGPIGLEIVNKSFPFKKSFTFLACIKVQLV